MVKELSVSVTDTAYQLHRSLLRLFRVLRVTRPADGLTLTKLGVLGRLQREGKATAAELAAYLRIRPQSLTRLIADLERGKFIIRRLGSEDHRQNPLEITKAGLELLARDIRDQRAQLARVIDKELTPAEQELLRIAAGLLDRIAETTEAAVELRREPQRSKGRGHST